IYDRHVHKVHVLDFDVLTKEMQQTMTDRLRMEHTDAQGHVVFTSHVEPLRRLCHRLIAFTISCRGQATEKLTTTDLFYLRKQSLQTLTVKVHGLTTIDIDELVRLRIRDRLTIDQSRFATWMIGRVTQLNYASDLRCRTLMAHAASAVLNFSENCTPDILTPYLDGIVSKLLVLLQEQFQKYYDAVMPYLKAILINANDKANRMLRAKAMECISLVGMAVGKDKFRDDAKQVMEVLMSLQGAQMETDDPTTSYMLQAWARLCKCLGQDFLPYMAVVMPPLLQSAQLKPDVIITSADSDNELESDDESMETITLGDKRIGIKTSVLEEKATACNMLCCYADELKEGFFPWIDQVAPILVPLLKFYFHEEVRKAAVSDENQVRSIVDEIKQVITASSSRKGERAERTKAEDFDAEEGELLKEENEQEEEVFDQVGEVLGTLVKAFKASFLPFFDELSTYLMPMLCGGAALRYKTTNTILYLLFGSEHGGSVIKPLIGEALSRLNAVIRHPNALHPDNVMAYDNAVSALGKVCHFHRDRDVIEAKAVHELLSVMVERSDAELLGPNNQYLPKIVSIFAEILCAGKELASDQTISRIINLLRQLQQTLPPATLASTWSALQPQQQLALQSILSS
nr:hypothetical protein [Tanacetum cinerariifolium]